MFNNFELMESDLRRRAQELPYIWGRKQNNDFDSMTRDVYNIKDLQSLLLKYPNDRSDLSNYAHNRWFNFHSAKCIEDIFCSHPGVVRENNKYHQSIDFYINGVPYDHKTTVLPRSFYGSLNVTDTEDFEISLIRWLYKNQSTGQMYHLGNRLFLVVIDSYDLESSWKVKAELSLIKEHIDMFIGNGGNIYNFRCEETGTRFSSGIIVVRV